jgi:hypothetical protein
MTAIRLECKESCVGLAWVYVPSSLLISFFAAFKRAAYLALE